MTSSLLGVVVVSGILLLFFFVSSVVDAFLVAVVVWLLQVMGVIGNRVMCVKELGLVA